MAYVNITRVEDALPCVDLLKTLREFDSDQALLDQLDRQFENSYQIIALIENKQCLALCGFRLLENLARGYYMHIDDLITDPDLRNSGHGEALFDHVVERAQEYGCTRVDLDSRVERHDASRFYFNQRMSIISYHFSLGLYSDG